MLNKIENSISYWNHSKISAAGKTVLINSYILSTPMYYLSVYPVRDFILDILAKLARIFFWSKGGDGKGIHSVGWKDITLDHTEEGPLSHKS